MLVAAFLLAASGAVVAPAQPAYADTFGTGSDGSGFRADGAQHTWCTTLSWNDSWWNPANAAVQNLDGQTDMYDTYYSLCNASIDAQFHISNSAAMGSTVRGAYVCVLKASTYVCNGARLLLNENLLTSATARQKTACHELGHSAGLSHNGSYGGCMVSGASSNRTYSAHHVAHINAAY